MELSVKSANIITRGIINPESNQPKVKTEDSKKLAEEAQKRLDTGSRDAKESVFLMMDILFDHHYKYVESQQEYYHKHEAFKGYVNNRYGVEL